MAVHGTPRSAGSVHECAPSPPTALQICGSLARRVRRMFVAGFCCRSSCGSLLRCCSVFHICSFAAVHYRQPLLSRRCSSATNHCHCLLTRLHRSAPPLVSRCCSPPHPTQVAPPPTWIWHLSLLRCHVRYKLFCCHTVVAPPRHPLLTATVIIRCAVALLPLLRRLIVAS
jgi:hypothetical protein